MTAITVGEHIAELVEVVLAGQHENHRVLAGGAGHNELALRAGVEDHTSVHHVGRDTGGGTDGEKTRETHGNNTNRTVRVVYFATNIRGKLGQMRLVWVGHGRGCN